jgi:hypothetical protein
LGRIETGGANTSNSRGAIVDPGGTAFADNATSVELLASTSFDYRWVVVAAGFGAALTAATNTWLIDIGVGPNGSEVWIINDLLCGLGSADDVFHEAWAMPVSIMAGSRIAVRARAAINTATSRIVDVAIYGAG